MAAMGGRLINAAGDRGLGLDWLNTICRRSLEATAQPDPATRSTTPVNRSLIIASSPRPRLAVCGSSGAESTAVLARANSVI